MYKDIQKYFSNHVYYNSAIHVVFGMGLGMLLTYPVAGSHPVRFGLALLAIGLLGHLMPLINKK